MEITGCEDEENDGSVCDARGSWVVPGEESCEEGVIVGEGLPSSGLCVRGGSGGSEVGEFVRGLRGLVLHAGCDRACCVMISCELADEECKHTVDGVLSNGVVLDGTGSS